MTKIQMTEEIITSKKVLGLSWEEIASKVGLAPVFLTSACFGMNQDEVWNTLENCYKVFGITPQPHPEV